MKRSELKRTPFRRKRQKPMARRSKTNSRPHANKSIREQYRREHPRCLLCSNPTDEIHHIRRGCLRVDHPANLAALCWEHHQAVHDPKSVYAAMTIEILYRKLLIGEFDLVALDAIGKPLIAGWLDRHRPGACNPELCHQWFRLVEECKRASD